MTHEARREMPSNVCCNNIEENHSGMFASKNKNVLGLHCVTQAKHTIVAIVNRNYLHNNYSSAENAWSWQA